MVNSNHSVFPEDETDVRSPSNVIVFFIIVLVGCLVAHHPCTLMAHDILDLPLF
jgi:hypothetical protein